MTYLRFWRPWTHVVLCPLIVFSSCLVQNNGAKHSTEAHPKPYFRDIAQETGLLFEHFIGATGEYFLPEIMGAGVALLDFDSDGDLDVYVLQGALLDTSRQLEDAQFPPPGEHWPGNRLFRNELNPDGELRFSDATEKSGLGHSGYGMGAAVGDYDNDGDPDLYITNFGSNVLYQNDGDGTFSDVTNTAGVDDPHWSTSAAFVDYDRDGDLDLFVTDYVDFTIRNNKSCYDPTGAQDYCKPTVYKPLPDRLFRNEGQGQFRDVSQDSGIAKASGNGLGVACADFDRDGWIDIYVGNDGTPNHLWHNNGDGSFSEIALMTGSAVDADGMPEASMGVTVGDFDADSDEDLFMTHLAKETNTLYLNDGTGNFHDATNRFGLGSISFPHTGFGTEWFDYDNDGWLDIFIANGAVTIVESLRGSPYPFGQKNQLLRNLEGRAFKDVSPRAALELELLEVSRGAAFGDVDNDGDVDVVMTNNNGPLRFFQNTIGTKNNWLQIRVEGVEGPQDGYGTQVGVECEGQPPLWRRVHTDGSYLSTRDPRVHFGLNRSERIERILLIWPSGYREIWSDLSINTMHVLREGAGRPLAK